MSTLWDDILREAGGEAIEAVVIGDLGYGFDTSDPRDAAVAPVRGQVISAEQAKPLLDYDYDRMHGSPVSHALWAWTANWVLFGINYDGATGIERVPRHPVSGAPEAI